MWKAWAVRPYNVHEYVFKHSFSRCSTKEENQLLHIERNMTNASQRSQRKNRVNSPTFPTRVTHNRANVCLACSPSPWSSSGFIWGVPAMGVPQKSLDGVYVSWKIPSYFSSGWELGLALWHYGNPHTMPSDVQWIYAVLIRLMSWSTGDPLASTLTNFASKCNVDDQGPAWRKGKNYCAQHTKVQN